VLLHATAVHVDHIGILLRGAPGSGKSSLAIELISRGGQLVADDQVQLTAEDGVLIAQPPAALSGLLECRGAGILRQTEPVQPARIHLEIRLEDDPPRLLEAPASACYEGIEIPAFSLPCHDVANAARILLLCRIFPQQGREARYCLHAPE
jgi:HPr kinase/phosphorylase